MISWHAHDNISKMWIAVISASREKVTKIVEKPPAKRDESVNKYFFFFIICCLIKKTEEIAEEI